MELVDADLVSDIWLLKKMKDLFIKYRYKIQMLY